MRSAVLVFCGQAQTKAHECHCPKIQRKYSGNAHVIRALIFEVRANRDGVQQRRTDVVLLTNQRPCATAGFEVLSLTPGYPPECSVVSLVSGNR